MGKRVHVVKKQEKYGDSEAFNWKQDEFIDLLESLNCQIDNNEDDRFEVLAEEYECAINYLKDIKAGKTDFDDIDLLEFNEALEDLDYSIDELIEVMATEPKILKYIDIPMQHCNGRILKLMNRKGDRKSLTELVDRLRKEIPGITIRTTFMTGFPSETKEEFTELSEFVEEMRFERMGCFAYSIEEDTPAAKMKDQIDEDVKRRRQEIIMEQQSRIMAENTRRYINKRINVLCEGYDRQTECYFGRSAADAPEVDARVYFISGDKKPRIGDVVRVAISDSLDCDLMGTIDN